jgi:hypothetical protein
VPHVTVIYVLAAIGAFSLVCGTLAAVGLLWLVWTVKAEAKPQMPCRLEP